VLWDVWVDPSQVDQILANLAVNARDAMFEHGTITLETRNIVVDEDFRRMHPEAGLTEYVCISISDSGCGIPTEILGRIFEPFFTTKPQGRGTGLGLAMVYGILKQNQGFISVYSVPNQGTTFRLYFPRHHEQREKPEEKPGSAPLPLGTETLLVVEDEGALLETIRLSLEGAGYRVLFTDEPLQALDLAAREPGPIHLLLTDVIMPNLNGREVAERIREVRPETRILFMSGYSGSALQDPKSLESAYGFLAKPFTRSELLVAIRTALDAPAKGSIP
jgi:CheY-like chemotaxis protein